MPRVNRVFALQDDVSPVLGPASVIGLLSLVAGLAGLLLTLIPLGPFRRTGEIILGIAIVGVLLSVLFVIVMNGFVMWALTGIGNPRDTHDGPFYRKLVMTLWLPVFVLGALLGLGAAAGGGFWGKLIGLPALFLSAAAVVLLLLRLFFAWVPRRCVGLRCRLRNRAEWKVTRPGIHFCPFSSVIAVPRTLELCFDVEARPRMAGLYLFGSMEIEIAECFAAQLINEAGRFDPDGPVSDLLERHGMAERALGDPSLSSLARPGELTERLIAAWNEGPAAEGSFKLEKLRLIAAETRVNDRVFAGMRSIYPLGQVISNVQGLKLKIECWIGDGESEVSRADGDSLKEVWAEVVRAETERSLDFILEPSELIDKMERLGIERFGEGFGRLLVSQFLIEFPQQPPSGPGESK